MANGVLLAHERADVLKHGLRNTEAKVLTCASEAELMKAMGNVHEEIRLVILDENIFKGREPEINHSKVIAGFETAFPNAGLLYMTGNVDSLKGRVASIAAESGTPDFVYGARTSELVTPFVMDETVNTVLPTGSHFEAKVSLDATVWRTL